jgi:hypothetical protein
VSDFNAIYDRLGALREAVGNLASEQKHSRDRDEKIFTRLEELGTFVAQHKGVEDRLKSVEEGVADYKSLKRTGMTLWALAVSFSGLVGGLIAHYFGFGKS